MTVLIFICSLASPMVCLFVPQKAPIIRGGGIMFILLSIMFFVAPQTNNGIPSAIAAGLGFLFGGIILISRGMA